MGRHSDSDEDRKRKKKSKRRSRSRSSSLDSHTSKHSRHKKSKKSSKHKHKSRSRSRSSERSYKFRSKRRSRSRSRERRRSRSRSRSKPRAYRRSRSRSLSRQRKKSRSRSKSPSRNRSRRSRSRSRRRSRSRSPKSRRSSRSRSRERSRRDRSRSRDRDKRDLSPVVVKADVRKEKEDPCASIPGFDMMTPAEQAETRLQMALKAAAAAGEKLKEQGVLGPSATAGSLSFQDQQQRSRAIENIESDNFVQKVFKSSRQQGADPSVESLHENAIFGLGDLTLKTEASQRLRAKDVDSHMHPNLYISSEDKMDHWITKLESMRRRKLEGEEME